MIRVDVLIPAAGAARRMRGRDKLLEPVGGCPQLRRVAAMAMAAGAPTVVALPRGDVARREVLEGLAVRIVEVRDTAEGMAASLRAGVAALPPDCAGVMILPADMPGIDANDIQCLCEVFRADPQAPILRGAAADGTPGHPVLFPARLFGALAEVAGDQGAREVLRRNAAQVRHVTLPGDHAVLDLDTPEDWHRWRARNDAPGD